MRQNGRKVIKRTTPISGNNTQTYVTISSAQPFNGWMQMFKNALKWKSNKADQHSVQPSHSQSLLQRIQQKQNIRLWHLIQQLQRKQSQQPHERHSSKQPGHQLKSHQDQHWEQQSTKQSQQECNLFINDDKKQQQHKMW